MFKDIKDFHEKFGLRRDEKPGPLNEELQDFRIKFLKEELQEYIDSVNINDMHGAFDALIDLVYVALGTAYLHGFQFDDGWELVHAANMKKVRAERADESKRGTQYDIVKPEGWVAPDLSKLL